MLKMCNTLRYAPENNLFLLLLVLLQPDPANMGMAPCGPWARIPCEEETSAAGGASRYFVFDRIFFNTIALLGGPKSVCS